MFYSLALIVGTKVNLLINYDNSRIIVSIF